MIQFDINKLRLPPKRPKTRDERIREKYENYPVWLLYWWKFESEHKNSLREFRKTISEQEHTLGRKHSSTPMIEVGKIIDKYNTWTWKK